MTKLKIVTIIIITMLLTAKIALADVEFQEIESSFKKLTSFQWKNYADSLNGEKTTGWQGYVIDVVQQKNGKYNLLIDMDKADNFGISEVSIVNMDEIQIVSYNKGEKIYFYGTILEIKKTSRSFVVIIE
jgi:hypothetical protein